jgi:hypothetical protein
LTHQASRHGVPATYGGRQYPDAGGLMSYGSDLADERSWNALNAGFLAGAHRRHVEHLADVSTTTPDAACP